MGKVALFEYAAPTNLDLIMNFSAGIWSWVLTPGAITVADDNGNTGYHEDTNDTKYPLLDLRVDDNARGYSLSYAQVTSLDDCRTVDSSWYYDTDTTRLYIHFEDFEPPIGKEIYFGIATGFTYGSLTNGYFMNNTFCEPCIKSMGTLKNSIDPLFFGRLKYQGMKINFINTSGLFDDWRSRNVFGQKTVLRIGDEGDSYLDFIVQHQGFIENDKRTFEDFQVKIQDPRQALTQPVATKILNQTDWPYLNDSNVNEVYPVRYGQLRNVPCICLNEDETTPTNYTFLLGDVRYNYLTASTGYVAGDGAITVSYDLNAGTMSILATDCEDADGNLILDEVTADMTWSIVNGVDIIKDLMYRYDGKNYLASFWDLTETAIAQTASRNTSLNINAGDIDLKKAIELVCVDIDARFFAHNDGTLTIRIYDSARAVDKIIYNDEWLDDPVISNNGSEFLTSAIIQYDKDYYNDKFLLYEETSYKDAAFDTYKKLKNKPFETGLYTLAEATEKGQTIMEISSNVSDIVTRTTGWQNSDLEISDFIACDPDSRLSDSESYSVYEVMSVDKNIRTLKCKFSLRYVRDYP